MSKNNFANMLRRTFQIAKQVNQHSSNDKSEVIQHMYESGLNRRKFIGNSIKSAALLAMGASFLEGCVNDVNESGVIVPNSGRGPRVAIIGGGIAGLNCAYELQKAGFASTIYEASNRSGGRMYSVHGVLAKGVTTDLGGEFVDSNHIHLLNLTNELGIGLIDRHQSQNNGLDKEVYFFNNQFYSESDVINALLPIANVIQADIDSLPDVITADQPGNAIQLDHISLAQYISNLNCVQWLKDLLTVAFVTEYGKDACEQSCINMLFLLSVNTTNGFKIFGSSNERYKIAGGSSAVTTKLSQLLKPHIQYEHSLVQVSQKNNGKYCLAFEKSGTGIAEVIADIVVFALPFTMLRNVTFAFSLPSWKRHAIDNLGYGTNAKLISGYTKRYWQTLGMAGEAFTQEDFQIGWDSSECQNSSEGAYTFYLGGKAGVDLGVGTEQFQFDKLKSGLESVFPGINTFHNGNVKRFHWPTHPYTKASYSCFSPGQWTTIAGNERKKVDQLYFCGEHCSLNFQGFMNGGAETGFKVAQKLIASF